MNQVRFVTALIGALLSTLLGFTVLSRGERAQHFANVINPNPIQASWVRRSVYRIDTKAQATSAPRLEGCVSCHEQIEPMHKYGTTETLEKLKDGRDAVGLTCTTCHGGNPVPRKASDDPKEIDRVKNE